MWELIEAFIQASLKTAQDPVGGPFPAYSAGKSWDEVPGKTSSGKKFHRNVPRTLMSAVPRQLLSTAMEANQSSFQLYSSGVLNASCDTKLEHGVLAVALKLKSMGKPELIYFDLAARGELTRLAFIAGGVDFTGTRRSFDA